MLLPFKQFATVTKLIKEEEDKFEFLDQYIYGLFNGYWEGDENIPLTEEDLRLIESDVATPESEQKRKDVAGTRISKMFHHFGQPTEKAPGTPELQKRVSARFDELSKMSPEKRKIEYANANRVAKAVGMGDPLTSNAKTDTAAEIPTKHGPKGQIPVALSLTPDSRRHYTSPDASTYKEVNSCPASFGGCRKSCLAKHGNYGFATNKGHMDASAQSLTHNEAATANHATRVHAQLSSTAKKAKGEGKSVLARFSTTDESGSDIYGPAVEKHFGLAAHKENPELSKTHAPVIQMRYSKRMDAPHAPERGIHAVFSDPGPMVTRSATGTYGIEKENLSRRKLMRKATHGDDAKATYTVFNKKRPGATSGPDAPETKQYNSILNNLHTVRRYEEHHSTPDKGETSEFHNKAGFGRVLHNGKSFRYQDHPVADKIKDVHGEMLFPADHDSRNADTSSREFKNRHGQKVGHVVAALATASTSNENLHNSGFFHHTEHIQDGIYHDGHPAHMELGGHVAKHEDEMGPKVKPVISFGKKDSK